MTYNTMNMKKTLLDYLCWKNPKSLADTEEERYFQNHLSYFSPATRIYRNDTDFFHLLKAYIVLVGLNNRKEINEYLTKHQIDFNLDEYHKFLSMLPQMEDKDNPIFIPTYSRSINSRYFLHPDVFNHFPYDTLLKDDKASLIDPFIVYGPDLFFTFCNVIKLKSCDNESFACYHEKMETIYIMNDNGGLEAEIPLFDEKMKSKDKTNLYDRLSIIVKDYFDLDRTSFIQHLESERLISPQLKNDLSHYEMKRQKRKDSIQ